MKFKEKTCQFCGKTFIPNSSRQKYCKEPHERICPICGKTYIEKNSHQLNFPPHACSYECRGKLQKITKAKKPKKETKLQIACHSFESFHQNLFTVDLYNKSHVAVEFEKLLQDNNIRYWMNFHLDDQNYLFRLQDYNLLITQADYGCDQKENLHKILLAEKHNYQCLLIYPWDDYNKIINHLKQKEIINAGDCQIYRLHKDIAIQFLNTYDLHNSCRNQLIYLGLVKDQELIQVMTFGKARRSKNHYVEILRNCINPKYDIVNGSKKLFNYALTYFALDDIIIYHDIAKFPIYEHNMIDMNFLRTTPPQEIWSKEDKYITANLLRSHGYDQLFDTNYGKGTNNELLMLENGWLPVYDCGQAVYEYRSN